MSKPKKDKPVLYLIKPTPEAIVKLYQKLTGEEMTPEGKKYAEQKLGTKPKP